MGMSFLCPNHLEVLSHSRVKIAILGFVVTHGKTFPCPWTKAKVECGVEFSSAFQPICWYERVIVFLFVMVPVGGKQIDCVYAVFMPLWEVELLVGVVIGQKFEKGAMTNGLILSVHLSRFA